MPIPIFNWNDEMPKMMNSQNKCVCFTKSIALLLLIVIHQIKKSSKYSYLSMSIKLNNFAHVKYLLRIFSLQWLILHHLQFQRIDCWLCVVCRTVHDRIFQNQTVFNCVYNVYISNSDCFYALNLSTIFRAFSIICNLWCV